MDKQQGVPSGTMDRVAEESTWLTSDTSVNQKGGKEGRFRLCKAESAMVPDQRLAPIQAMSPFLARVITSLAISTFDSTSQTQRMCQCAKQEASTK